MNSAVHDAPVADTRNGGNKPLWAAVGVLGVAVLALGASLVYVQMRPANTPASPVAAATALEPLPAPPVTAARETPDDLAAPPPKAPAVTAKPPAPKPAAKAPAPRPVPSVSADNGPVPTVVAQNGSGGSALPAPAPVPRAICSNCGTIESVTPIERKGQGSGVGAVGGGVLGAVLGNQIGKGNGRTVATVLGAVGGGLAGNAIEKNVKKETVYQAQVRMEDGSTRSFEQATMPTVGTRVVVENGVWHAAER